MKSNLGARFINQLPDSNGDHYTAFAELSKEFSHGLPDHFYLAAYGTSQPEAYNLLMDTIDKEYPDYQCLDLIES